MGPRDAFKVAFLDACAERGLSIAETHALVKQALARPGLVKQSALLGMETGAQPGVEKSAIAPAIATALAMLSGAGPYVIPAAVAAGVGAPVAAGLFGGHVAAKAQEDDTKLERAKADELVMAFRQLAAETKRRTAASRMAGGGMR